nr:SPOR domain-containing protein [Candidatus Photodesmus blepharus]
MYTNPTRVTPKLIRNKQNYYKPWLNYLLLITLSGIFGYGLYLLENDQELPTPVVKDQTKPTTEVIPPLPKEKWEYVESLPKREIKVKAKEQIISKIPYIMQCGAYKTIREAKARKLDIAFQGIQSKIRKERDSSWYRVVLGPYEFKRDAERDKHKLQRTKIEPCAIWKEK